jgi:hypothetical protein
LRVQQSASRSASFGSTLLGVSGFSSTPPDAPVFQGRAEVSPSNSITKVQIRAFVAAETGPALSIRDDEERRVFSRMERTQPLEIAPDFWSWMAVDDIRNI